MIYEQGLMLQLNVQKNFALLLGGGYNEDNSGNQNFSIVGGHGYTIRGGILQYLGDNHRFYFSWQAFFRNWQCINAVAEDDEGFTQGIDDQVINPFRQNLNSVAIGDGIQVDLYNAHAYIISNDFVWGYQVGKRHFILDLFWGAGWRSKVIYLTKTGYYNNPVGGTSVGPLTAFDHPRSKTVYYSYPDGQLGFTLGYRFY